MVKTIKTIKTKGGMFAKKTIAHIYRPAVLRRGFNSLLRIPKVAEESFFDPIPDTGLNLNVMSFNVRRGTAKDGKNHWIFRRNRVSELLNAYRPDLLGLQEAMDFQISEISAMLPGYEMVGTGNLGGNKGLHTAIFYDAVRFEPSAEGTFWFSDTPDISGSKGWGNIIPRTCTWARLIEKESGQAFYLYNVHLDHISLRSRKNSVVLLTDFIHSRSSADPYILTGDFNAREQSAPVQYLKGNKSLRIKSRESIFNIEPLRDTFRDRYPNVRNVCTFHGFRRYFFRFKLDYIFVPSSFRVRDAKIIQPRWKKYYASDHFPLFTRIDLSVIPAAADPGIYAEKAVNGE